MGCWTRWLLALVPLVAGCGGSLPAGEYLPGRPVALFDGPLHLGNDIADGQSFPSGPAIAARVCSLVNVSEATDAFIQVRNVRSTETLSNQLTVNATAFSLPMTLERDPYGVTSNAMAVSPVQHVHLEAGPSEVCLVSGVRPSGDLDDFEVEQVVLYVKDISDREVSVRRGLALGAPPPVLRPSTPWGRQQ